MNWRQRRARRYLWGADYKGLRLAFTRNHGRSRRFAGQLWAYQRGGYPIDLLAWRFLYDRNTAYVVWGRYSF